MVCLCVCQRWTLLLSVLLSLPMTLFAFTKVIVPAVYHEWNNGKPHWVTQPEIQKKFNYSVFAYQKLDPNGTNYFEYNHGTETGVYLKYIVDHYDDFPDVAIFVHAKPHEHQTNWLHMVGCISPNATWYNINHGDSQWTTRSPEYWLEHPPTMWSSFKCHLSLYYTGKKMDWPKSNAGVMCSKPSGK